MKQDVDVLAVFETGAEYPKPVRFKLLENGIKKTVSVGRITDVDHLGAGGMLRYEYKCESPGAAEALQYRLKYYYKKQMWELVADSEDPE